MEPLFRDKFITLWEKNFNNAELPIAFAYTHGDGGADPAPKPKGRSCLICELAKVRKGKSLWYNIDSLACGGARRYLGYTEKMRPGFEYFLSCGNAGIEGERYIRTPEMVNELMRNQKSPEIDGKNIVFKRWDKLTDTDTPDVVVFFAEPDVLAGLFTLANFDQSEPNGTICPFGSGCGTMIYYPYLESKTERQRCVIGMFDPSARPCVPDNVITFAVPFKRFEKMVSYMEETFLITDTWTTVKKRIR